jgi:hypothetical protein
MMSDEVIVSELLPGFQGSVSQLGLDAEPEQGRGSSNRP